MSTQLVRDQIAAFLKTETPEVLCIRGRWGTGKTYNWQTTIKQLKGKAETVALSQYAYVSLFGVGSINQIKAAILQNTVTRDKIGDFITSESISAALSKGEKALKSGFLKLLRWVARAFSMQPSLGWRCCQRRRSSVLMIWRGRPTELLLATFWASFPT
ncbi:hypothetical protein [Mesorhizobium sp. BH1-1-4]|uniref:hypothetical protein n=1 Tax=Mesorhizobium sp. BH1-1-4 TaxID=2876662 RepID=UPI001CD12639|nr:hypothetical protein [Mesorhizobium sp. BH1-1-4]MBZ9998031.1 hypothetical protein [Mesorhizobium sp. BH1-1-4]